MRIVALCSSPAKAFHLSQTLDRESEGELWFLVPNSNRRPKAFFALLLFAHTLKKGLRCSLWALRSLLRRRLLFSLGALEDDVVLQKIRRLRPDVGLHATGVIYRRPLIDCFRLGILNAHIGLLPRYRGRSVMEWSLLNGDPTGVTTFFIDDGIDTGARIVLRRHVDVFDCRTVGDAKGYLFSLDGAMYAEALRRLRTADFVPETQSPEEGVRWFVMSRLFTSVVDRILEDAATSASTG